MSTFSPPPIYDLPPFFTLQPVAATRERQIALWCDVVLSYCRAKKIFNLDRSSPVWHHDKLNIRFSPEGVDIVMDSLLSSQRAILESGRPAASADGRPIIVLWKTVAEWASEFKQWAVLSALDSSVCTVEELSTGEGHTPLPPFAPCPPGLVEAVCRTLAQNRQCELMLDDDERVEGIRFTFVV